MWPTSDETQELLASARRGDREAVNRLLDRHRQALRRMVALRLDRGVARRVDASDVVQDVLLEANQRLADYLADPRMPFPAWLRHLAKDRMIEMFRQHRGAQRRSIDREQSLSAPDGDDDSLDGLAQQILDPELTPAAATLRNEVRVRLLKALDTLDDDDKDLILMRHFEQLGNSETAEILGLSPAAAGMRHIRALRKLGSLLSDAGSISLPPAGE